MAEANPNRGNMDISQHQETYRYFVAIVKWGTILTAASAVLATILTHVWFDGVTFFMQ